jgi:MarR family transcriptional regulator, organic hydroperoxide resistance regulator
MRRSKLETAAEVWRLMAEFTFERFKHGEHQVLLRELGLTPGHLKALLILDPDEPRPMRAMAGAMNIDASMATWLVDRLEERGLVERRGEPADRRVKTVVLTPRGIEVRERLREALYEAPPELLALDAVRLEAGAGIMGERSTRDPASSGANPPIVHA